MEEIMNEEMMTEEVIEENEVIEEEFMFVEPEYKVYIQVDENGIVKRIDADWNISDVENWVYLDSGSTDRFHHAQSCYLEKGLFDEQGRWNYAYRNEALVELTEEEKCELFPPVMPAASFEEEQLDFNLDIDYRVTCLELGTIAELVDIEE